MVLGLARRGLLILSDTLARYVTAGSRSLFWQGTRRRVLWFFLPGVLLRELSPPMSGALFGYHLVISVFSSAFRLAAIFVPMFMAVHVNFCRRGFGVSWATMPPVVADIFSWTIIGLGCLLFLARLYSRVLRSIEPPWSHVKPLILIAPFITGLFAANPLYCPIDYHAMLLLHVLSASLVFSLVGFGKMLSFMHAPFSSVFPGMGDDAEEESQQGTEVRRPVVLEGVTS